MLSEFFMFSNVLYNQPKIFTNFAMHLVLLVKMLFHEFLSYVS